MCLTLPSSFKKEILDDLPVNTTAYPVPPPVSQWIDFGALECTLLRAALTPFAISGLVAIHKPANKPEKSHPRGVCLPVKRDEMPTIKASLRTNYKIAFLNPDQYLEYYIWGPFVPHELQEMFLLS